MNHVNDIDSKCAVTAVSIHAAATGGGHGPGVLQLAVGGPQVAEAAPVGRRRRDHARARAERVQLSAFEADLRHETLARSGWQHRFSRQDMVHARGSW